MPVSFASTVLVVDGNDQVQELALAVDGTFWDAASTEPSLEASLHTTTPMEEGFFDAVQQSHDMHKSMGYVRGKKHFW